MFTLTFDKGLASERSIALESFFEHPISHMLTGTVSAAVAPGAELPEAGGFSEQSAFSTVAAADEDGVNIPIAGKYNRIVDLTITYNSTNKRLTLNIVLDYFEGGDSDKTDESNE